MPLPPGFILEEQPQLPPGFVLEGQIQDLNSTEHLDAPQTLGRRLRNLPVVGEAINRLLGPEMAAPTLIGGQQEGVLNQIVQGLTGPLTASPAMVMRQPQSYPEAVVHGVAEQVNPQNVLLGGTLGALHKAQDAGALVNWLKATIAAYFAKQGAEMGGSALGERLSGAPVAPERKGELDVQTAMGALMGLGPLLGMKGEQPKQTDVGPPSSNLTIQDIEQIEGRLSPERRITQFAQHQEPPLNILGSRPGQVPIRGLEQYPQPGEGRVAGAGPIMEKRPSQEVPRVIGEPIIGQRLVQPNVPEGFVLEQASQAAGEPKQGGQISFESEAKAGAIPSARQTAVETPIEKRGPQGGNISAFGLFDPAGYRPAFELMKEFKAKVMDGNQIMNRLRNKLHPDEWKMFEDAGIVQAFGNKKVDPQEVQKWMTENGPRVEVRTFGEGGLSAEEKEYNQMSHEWYDNLSHNVKNDVLLILAGREAPRLSAKQTEKALRYKELRAKFEGRLMSERMSQQAHWSSIAPKSEQDIPGYVEGAVTIPTKNKNVGNYTRQEQNLEPDVLFPSSHSFPPNTLAFWRGYMETTPEGKKVFHIIEVQSDWAQRLREIKEREGIATERGYAPTDTSGRPQNHPLLRQYERLALKSAIEHARKEGADAIAISDAETAMMTEGHDLQARERTMQDPMGDPEEKVIPQEPGMRLHYDRTLPGILEELTGQKGERVEFGEHKMARQGTTDYVTLRNPTTGEEASPGYYEAEGYRQRGFTEVLQGQAPWQEGSKRSNLIFRSPSGEPKTSVSAKMFPLDKTQKDFTAFGKDRPLAEAATFKAPEGRPTGKGMQLKPKDRSEEGAIGTGPIQELGDRFVATLKVLSDAAKRRGVKGDITALNRAVDNLSFRAQAQAENHMKLEASKWFKDKSQTALNAMFAMLEGAKAGGLPAALTKSAKNKEMQEAVRFAQDPANRAGLISMVNELKKMDAQNMTWARANGVDIPSIDNYLKHVYGSEPRPFFFFEKPSPGIGMGSKVARKFPTIFDAIEAGHKPLTLDAAALMGKRTQEIFQEVQTKKWLDGFRTVKDPATGEPVVANLGKLGLPPEGYSKVNGLNVAVKDGYKSIFTALTGESHVSNNMFGQALLEGEGAIKHGTLAFDVFHAARIAQFAKSIDTGIGYKKGLSLLEYSDKDLAEAVKQGLAPKEALAYQNEVNDLPQGRYTNRQLGSLAVQQGANIARHSEAIYSSFVRTFPGLKQTVGRFNRWVFDKMSRGALYEANVAEIKRIAEARPDLTIQQVARMVSRDLNYRFGNIQKQGLIKGKTIQDLSQLLLLAPKWFESLGQSEARSVGQVVRSLTPGQHLGTLGFSSAKLLTAYVLGTQAINLIFNGHTTFQNKNNKGHELDAYIPALTKDGKGFYISPLSVVGELAHDILRYTRHSDKPKTVDKVIDAGARIVGNKLSPPIHGLWELATGEDYKGEKSEGWNRVLNAFVTGVNPSPLPIKQTVQSLKEKDVAPAERQAFSMLGIKAEPESFTDVRQRKIEELGKAPFAERAKLEKDLKAMRPTASDEAKLAAGQRAMEAQLQRKNALREQLPDDIQGWLKDKKLDIQGFVPEITKNKQRITLTEREREWFLNELSTQYERFLKPWVGQDVTQERLNSRLLQARNTARRNLLNAIESDSINESDRKKNGK